MKTLIVYYSLEGNTEYAAKRIADKLGADTLRLYPVKEYKSSGVGKFLEGGRDAMRGAKPELMDYDVNLAKYDRIIIGFPVWASNIAPPIRTFIAEHRGTIKRKEVVAFACQGGSGAEKAFIKLKKELGVDMLNLEAVFISPKQKRSLETDRMIDAFCKLIKEADGGEEKENMEEKNFEEMSVEEQVEETVKVVAKVVSILKSLLNFGAETGGKAAGAAAGAVKSGIEKGSEKIAEKRSDAGESDFDWSTPANSKGIKRSRQRKYLTHWNYKKHAKLCAAVYVPLIAFDMTVSYLIIKKVLDDLDEKEGV